MDQKSKIQAAIEAHTMWFLRIRTAIEKKISDFKPEIVKTDNNCEFGKWLYGDFPLEFRNTPIYREIKEHHAKFHQLAGKILELALSGKTQEAVKAMEAGSEFKVLSLGLITKLNALKKLL